MSDWQVPEKFGQELKVDEIYCEEQDYRFIIKAIKECSIIFLENNKDLLQEYIKHKITTKVLLLEWNEYRLKIEKNGSNIDEAKVFSGDQEINKDKYEKFYPLQWTNQLGRVRLMVEIEGGRISLPEIEVVSPKLEPEKSEDELFYPKFYGILRDELIQHCLSFPFHFLSPTYHIAEETPRPPSLLFLFHYFKNKDRAIKDAFSIVFNQPYKRLVDERRWVNIAKVKMIDSEVVHDIIVHPERWAETTSRVPLAEKLKIGDKRYLPMLVLQREKFETYDVPENRFVKFFWMRLLSGLDEVMGRYKNEFDKKEFDRKELREIGEKLQSLRWELQSYQREALIEEAKEMDIFPANSTVLMRREGYRQLLQLYREFLLSYCPIFDDLESALEARSIDALYEYWCFFKIAKLLENIFGKGRVELIIEPLHEGLKGGTTVSYKSNYRLVYNKEFVRGKNRSYSIKLVPDFVIMNKGKAIFALDAKFRFETKLGDEGKSNTQREIDEIDIEKEEQEALNKRDIERIAKLEDILKMHTYMDALGLKAAIIVYPGTEWKLFRKPKEGEEPEIYGSNGANKGIGELSPGFEGIGFIPLIPGSEDKDYILIECVRKILNLENKIEGGE